MDFNKKLERLRGKILSMLCNIEDLPDGLLPHTVYVEENSEQSLRCGNSVFKSYYLNNIFSDGTCMFENPDTGVEEKRQLAEINIEWMVMVWKMYKYLIRKRKRLMKLLQLMELIAGAHIKGTYITDFTIHDTDFINRTKAETPFFWLVDESGTRIYLLNDKDEIQCFKDALIHYEKYSDQDFCLYRYDGQHLFPVFPKAAHEFIDNELKNYSD